MQGRTKELTLTGLVLIFLFFGFVNKSFANPHYDFNTLNQNDQEIYFDTIKSCSQGNDRTFKNFELTNHEKQVLIGTFLDVSASIEILVEEQDFKGAIGTFRKSRFLGLRLNELLNSLGFMYALKTCFQGNERKEYAYVLELILIDASVKGIVLSTSILSPIKFLMFISKYQWAFSLIMVGNFSFGYNLSQIIINYFKPSQQEIMKKKLNDILHEISSNYKLSP